MIAEVVYVESALKLASACSGAIYLVLELHAGGGCVLFRGCVVPTALWFQACTIKAWLLLNNCNMNVQNCIQLLLFFICSHELLF